ncbi:hypothetical protein A2U01_0070141, partial [Trifolium medium]|nr:hypothetical protein [Trifolium medium]
GKLSNRIASTGGIAGTGGASTGTSTATSTETSTGGTSTRATGTCITNFKTKIFKL